MAGLENLDIRLTRIAIIGAGWAGLSAAVELANAGYKVEVFEAARHLGGRARRVSRGGVDFDNGQHVLLGACRETLRVIRLAGGNPDRLLLRMPLELTYPGEFSLRTPAGLPAPLHLAAALTFAQGLTWLDRIAATRFMLGLHIRRFRVEPDISVAAFLDATGQTARVRKYLWEPLCVAALNTAPSEASASTFATVLRDSLTGARRHSDLLIPQVDLGRVFPDLAARFVESRAGVIRLGAAVTGLAATPDGLIVRFDDRESLFDRVICAAPPRQAGDFLDGASPAEQALRDVMGQFDYEPIVTCYLQYPQEMRLPRPMIGMSGAIGQWAFDRGALGGPHGLLAVVVSAAGMLRGLEGHVLAHAIHDELQRVLGPLPDSFSHWVITEKRATFKCTPGLARPPTRTPIKGLYLAGDHVDNAYPATLEGAVRTGVAAATTLIRDSARTADTKN